MPAAPASWALRGAILAGLLVAEFLAATIAFDTRDLVTKSGVLTSSLERWAPGTLQAAIVFLVAFGGLMAVRRKARVLAILADHPAPRMRWGTLAWHLAGYGSAFLLAVELFSPNPRVDLAPDLLAVACLAVGAIEVTLGLLAFAPASMLADLAKAGGDNWLYAGGMVALTQLSALWVQKLWTPATALTFSIVQILLRLMPGAVEADPATATIGTTRFSVTIARQCSGLEGAGLFLAFGILGLYVFRRDFRFPRALLLLPAGVLILYLFNAIRIAALILIGHLGAVQVATGGFHSQAGWISFNLVSLGLFALARRSVWLSPEQTGDPATETPAGVGNPVAAYLLPFLAIVATGMVVHAATADFEWLYPLKFLAVVPVFALYRRQYHSVDFRFGWHGILAGVVVFLLWIGLDFLTPARESGMPAPLAAAPLGWQWFWIGCRFLAAVVTVPIAEELAFRGFLMRRIASADFEQIRFGSFHLPGLMLSSVVFGLLHGDRWIAGILAGLIYGAVTVPRARLGDAVAAHALTNLLLALLVVFRGAWRFW